jgi:hypothetical protein
VGVAKAHEKFPAKKPKKAVAAQLDFLEDNAQWQVWIERPFWFKHNTLLKEIVCIIASLLATALVAIVRRSFGVLRRSK